MIINYHGLGFSAIHHSQKVLDDLSRIVVGNFGHPSSANTVSTIYQYHRYDGNVVSWFNFVIIIIFVSQQRIVIRMEYETSQWTVKQKKKLMYTIKIFNFHFFYCELTRLKNFHYTFYKQ